MTAGDLVPQDVYLMHSAKLLEQLPQIVLVHVVRHLAHEHFYVIRIRLLNAIVVHYAFSQLHIVVVVELKCRTAEQFIVEEQFLLLHSAVTIGTNQFTNILELGS